jgi:hypothetical protein
MTPHYPSVFHNIISSKNISTPHGFLMDSSFLIQKHCNYPKCCKFIFNNSHRKINDCFVENSKAFLNTPERASLDFYIFYFCK